jgi:hypothetical protein
MPNRLKSIASLLALRGVYTPLKRPLTQRKKCALLDLFGRVGVKVIVDSFGELC